MTTFAEWKSLPPVREMTAALIDIDLDALETWKAYKTAVFAADRSRVPALADRWSRMRDSGEIAALMGILWSMDYSDLAGTVGQQNGITNLLRTLNYADETHRRVVAGALDQRD